MTGLTAAMSSPWAAPQPPPPALPMPMPQLPQARAAVPVVDDAPLPVEWRGLNARDDEARRRFALNNPSPEEFEARVKRIIALQLFTCGKIGQAYTDLEHTRARSMEYPTEFYDPDHQLCIAYGITDKVKALELENFG